MNCATPEVEYWIRFSITWPSAGCAAIQPMRQPVIAQFLEKVLTKRMRSSGVHHVEERGRARPVAIAEARVDLVGDDPEAVPAREREQRGEVLARRGPAGRIGRRDDEERARARRDRGGEPVEVERPAVIAEATSAPRPARAPAMPVAAAAFGQAGVGISTSSPAPATIASAIWIACMPEPVTKNSSGANGAAVERRVIARERLAQFGNAALPGVEGLAGRERARRRLADEGRRRQIALAGPQRDHAAAPAAVVHRLDDAALGRARAARRSASVKARAAAAKVVHCEFDARDAARCI